MNGYTIPVEALDEAVAAAAEVLDAIGPDDTRHTIASKMTLAVLPKILGALDAQVQAIQFDVSQADARVSHAEAQLEAVITTGRAQDARLRMVIEEIDPGAVAAAVVGRFETAGHSIDPRDAVLIQSTVAQTIRTMAEAISFAVSAEVQDFLDTGS